ncbi:MAG: ATP-binding protein [Candidatus Omnitrophica bacterium]|nr:ATP-binding protein [Candidatus Omnitrophota bacterium]MDD5671809.1 ATP-binding protein [Candidatus Omnitrophota bacterium]
MTPYTFSLLFFSFCTFFISLLIWLKRNDNVAKIYFVFSCFVAVWSGGAAIMLTPNTSHSVAILGSRVSNSAALFIPVTWFHFCCVYTERQRKFKKSLLSFYLVTIFVGCFAFTPHFVTRTAPAMVFDNYTKPGVLYHMHTILYFIVVPIGFWQLFRKMKLTQGRERQQIKGLIIATFAGFFGGAFTFFPVYDIMVPQYGLFLLPVYPFVMAYFMIRKNLFDEYEMARAAQRDKLAAIGTLATSINHEIKNPLYIIQGFSDSFLANTEDGIFKNDAEALAKAREVLKKTGEQSQRALEIMKRFAAFSKQNLNREMQIEAVPLAALIENIMPLVRHELELDKIELTENIPADLPPVHADRRHLEEIFFNLIVNACQAMKSGGRIEIHAAFDAEKIRISVNDTGHGIPADKVAQIFEPFYTTKEEGTGLGLYVTRQLVERNGGRIMVDSKVGKGTSFVLEFPVMK